ncbi:hypothetical protein Tsubulata_026241 [Turnera subulata]|uniref:N-alpha-acetyltransferase 40 n=1 Tax=Turnera subulata TaxID=218843 RepID=A0A9Q0JQH3_9ROSI|nr:hypothetical protein Tsubulata_026241 [Turnera subulata]
MDSRNSQGNSNSSGSSRDKKAKRREIQAKKKAIDELIKRASAETDHLASFPPFRHFDRNGLSVYLESGSGDKLSSSLKQYIQNLLKVNMEKQFGPDWPMEEKVKRRDMVAPEARYIFVHEDPGPSANGILTQTDKGSLVGFVHYRFTLEEEIPVLYLYEIQLESRVQGLGLGKFLMQLMELIARKNHMGAVVLTVQKANAGAINFYTNKLRWEWRRVTKFFAKRLIARLKLHWRKTESVEPSGVSEESSELG